MANEPNQNAPQAPGIPVMVTAQYIKDLSFENPNAPQIFAPSAAQPEIAMNVNIQTRAIQQNVFEVMLILKIEARLQGAVAFISELSYGGTFSMPEMPEEQLRVFLLVEAPRLLFPFARGILMSAIRDGGFPQVIVNPVDFYSLYLANKDKIGAMPVAGAA